MPLDSAWKFTLVSSISHPFYAFWKSAKTALGRTELHWIGQDCIHNLAPSWRGIKNILQFWFEKFFVSDSLLNKRTIQKFTQEITHQTFPAIKLEVGPNRQILLLYLLGYHNNHWSGRIGPRVNPSTGQGPLDGLDGLVTWTLAGDLLPADHHQQVTPSFPPPALPYVSYRERAVGC